MTRICLVIAALFALTVVPAGADFITDFQTDTHVSSLTDWNDTLYFDKFDEGTEWTLTGVEWELTGDVSGSAGYENTSPSTADITVNLKATVEMQRPDTTFMAEAVPLASKTDLSVAAYDGTTDYAGASGETYTNLTDLDVDTGIITTGLGDWIGSSGQVGLPTSASGESYGSGSGSLELSFSTDAGAIGKIRYHYTYIPEPGTMGLMLMGLLGAGLIRRRRA